MKTRIIDNKPTNSYDEQFISENLENFINGAFVKDWILAPFYEGNFIKPFWNGTDYVESATPEEIAEQQQHQQIEQAKLFLQANKEAGDSYYNKINLRVTMGLIAVEKAVLFPILQEVDNLLYPPLNKIKTGDFASALFIFKNQTPPTNQFVLNFYNEAVQYCQNYYDTKYPKL